MKFEKWILLILTGVVAYLIWKMKPWQPQLVGHSPTSLGNSGTLQLGNPNTSIALYEPPATSNTVLAIDLAVKSTPQRLPSGRPKHGEVLFRTDSSNSGSVYLADSYSGASNTPRFSLPAGASEKVKITEIGKLFYYGTEGDKLSVFAELK